MQVHYLQMIVHFGNPAYIVHVGTERKKEML